MKVNTLRTSSTLTFWWDKPDTQISEYIYYLDGMETGRTEKTHFTLSSLESSREYKIRITAEGIDDYIGWMGLVNRAGYSDTDAEKTGRISQFTLGITTWYTAPIIFDSDGESAWLTRGHIHFLT